MKKSARARMEGSPRGGQLWLQLSGMVRKRWYDTGDSERGLACVDEVSGKWGTGGAVRRSATSIWPIARRCVEDTWRAR